MDEKIEEMAKCICPSYERKMDCETCPTEWCYAKECATMAFCNGYRKESDTAKEILTDIITGFVFGWKADNEDYRNGYCQALTDYDKKIKSYIKEKYGVDLD